MRKSLLLIAFGCIYSLTLSAATYYTINTTSPLHCYLSSNFQNRIMIDNGRIKKVVATECDRLSIQIEEVTGQAFIYARDPTVKETSISVVSETSVIQDIHICFMERMPEVVVLQDPEVTNCQISEIPNQQIGEQTYALNKVEEILTGKIPADYKLCPITASKWAPKKGIELELKTKLEGPVDTIYIYQATNLLKQQQTLLECELECEGSAWVYLETNTLIPKQKILSIVAVKNYE
jgi:hypothetical protein